MTSAPGTGRDPVATAAAPPLTATMVDDPDLLGAHLAPWRHLAATCGQPYGDPVWCLAWWRHVAPADAALRVVLVHDEDELVGVGAFAVERSLLGVVRYRPLGADVSPRRTPLAAPERRSAVAAALAGALATASPRPDVVEVEGSPSDAGWPELLADAWPGTRRPDVRRDGEVTAPGITIDRDLDQWLAARSRNFRQQARRHRRRLEADGASFRVVHDADDAVRALTDFQRLHEARWRYRGGSGVLDGHVMQMLATAAKAMAPEGRLLLHMIEVDGTVIAAHIFLAAGHELTYWLGGFDERWASEQPSLQALVDMVARGWAVGARHLDLGPGAQAYKQRLGDHDVVLNMARLLPIGPRRWLALADALPARWVAAGRRHAFSALPTEHKDQIKRLLRRVRR